MGEQQAVNGEQQAVMTKEDKYYLALSEAEDVVFQDIARGIGIKSKKAWEKMSDKKRKTFKPAFKEHADEWYREFFNFRQFDHRMCSCDEKKTMKKYQYDMGVEV